MQLHQEQRNQVGFFIELEILFDTFSGELLILIYRDDKI